MICYAFEGGQMMKDENGSIEYKGGQVITIFVNVNNSYDEFVSLVCALTSQKYPRIFIIIFLLYISGMI